MALPGKSLIVPTIHGQIEAKDIGWAIAVARHSRGHRLPPHRVNYLAIGSGLSKLGVEGCVATAAVGSVNPDFKVGTALLCTDLIDYTARSLTHYQDSVHHTDFTNPFDVEINRRLQGVWEENEGRALTTVKYACTDGPRYETPAEIARIRRDGADVVGMTAASEAISLREVGIPYSCVCIVTNAAASPGGAPLNHEEVVQAVEKAADRLFELIRKVCESCGGFRI